jgi:phosphate transport system protein
MERHFEHDLEEQKQRLLRMAGLAEMAVHQAMQAVFDKDEGMAKRVLEEERAINELQLEIDERVMQMLALHAPLAADLRFLLASARINNDLERIGDQAVNIAEAAVRILRHPQVKPYVDLPRMSGLVEGMVRDSLNALVQRTPELARTVLRRDDEVDSLRNRIFHELLTYMMENPVVIFPAFELILVTKNLERIGDHATNIAEDVIYMVAGLDVRHPGLERR